ncbi:hypothetical protein AM500_11185 [Bacillus sp. FJAT-18017]|uniref:hypothetical protein n=1 Tax=Bacillus sp. FJAT-18017 TaxID=1705566 RepID=UPI0006AE9550|nr:hypothetical protein [Bacillus sp. FJAT-18017]ALC90283.1 hypothetical protein AM500_11185 [Bacillus sp. FJAT-18017]
MGKGLALLGIVLIVYCIVVARTNTVDKKLKKWAILAAVLAGGLSVFIFMDISFDRFSVLLNGTVGDFTRMVVNK